MTITELQDALVFVGLIDRDAIDDPDGYDEGSTLAQIDELHKMLPRDDTALLRQALEALERLVPHGLTGANTRTEAMAALRERLGETT
jgi:hypothetical protein